MPWAIMGPAIAHAVTQIQANTDNSMVHRQRIQYGGMNMVVSNNQHGQQQSYEQKVLPESSYTPSMISQNPLMDTLTSLLKKDRESNTPNKFEP